MSETKKKNSAENWTIEDKRLLKKLVKEKIKILENKAIDPDTNHLKKKTWEKLEESFNKQSVISRNVVQLRCQWAIMKKDGFQMDEDSSLMGEIELCPDSISNSQDSCLSQTEFISDIDLETNQNKKPEFNHRIEDYKKESPKKRKRSSSENGETELIDIKSTEDYENVEVKCRLELHKAQMETERKKAENLDLERKVLLEKLKFYKKRNESL